MMEVESVVIVVQQLIQIISAIWGEDASILQRIASTAVLLTTAVGTASILFKALEKIAGVTPTTKDDEFVSKVKKWLGFLSSVLDRLALNPDKTKARNAK